MKLKTIVVSLIVITPISVILTAPHNAHGLLIMSVALNALFFGLIAAYMASARARAYTQKLFAVVLGAAVLTYTTPARAAGTGQSTDTQEAKPKITIFICYCAVAAAATYVVYSVYKCAQAANLTGTNAPAPPTPPAGTNGSTKIVFTSNASGPLPPGATTNGGAVVTAPVDTMFYPNITLATNNDAGVELKQDISTNGWTDWQGNPYTWYFSTYTDLNGPHVQYSTNLVDWTDAFYSVRMWVSSSVSPDPNLLHFTNLVTVVYDQYGIPVMTNFCTINTNTAAPVGVRTKAPQAYFRGVKP